MSCSPFRTSFSESKCTAFYGYPNNFVKTTPSLSCWKDNYILCYYTITKLKEYFENKGHCDKSKFSNSRSRNSEHVHVRAKNHLKFLWFWYVLIRYERSYKRMTTDQSGIHTKCQNYPREHRPHLSNCLYSTHFVLHPSSIQSLQIYVKLQIQNNVTHRSCSHGMMEIYE